MHSLSQRFLGAGAIALLLTTSAISAGPSASEKLTANGLKRFGFSLFQALKNDKTYTGPAAVSPLSLAEAMTLVTNGAEGETRAELERLFLTEKQREAGSDITVLTAGVKDLRAKLTDYAKRTGNSFVFTSANSLWANSSPDAKFTFRPEFLKLAKDGYAAHSLDRDFRSAETIQEINNWVKKESKGKLLTLLTELNKEDASVLLNAIYAKGRFVKPFFRVTEGEYTTKAGKKKVSYLKTAGPIPYFTDGKVKAYSFPVGKDDAKLPPEIALDVLVPIDGDVRALGNRMDADYYDAVITGLKPTGIELEMPAGRVQMDAAASLKTILQAAPFDLKRSFDGVSAQFGLIGTSEPKKNLAIGQVLTKTFYEVTPFGFEASAASAVLMGYGSAPPKNEKHTVRTAALHVIRHIATGAPLFVVEYDSPLLYTEDELVAFVLESYNTGHFLTAEFQGDEIGRAGDKEGRLVLARIHTDPKTQKQTLVKIYKILAGKD